MPGEVWTIRRATNAVAVTASAKPATMMATMSDECARECRCPCGPGASEVSDMVGASARSLPGGICPEYGVPPLQRAAPGDVGQLSPGSVAALSGEWGLRRPL